jgi:hypothetical protein
MIDHVIGQWLIDSIIASAVSGVQAHFQNTLSPIVVTPGEGSPTFPVGVAFSIPTKLNYSDSPYPNPCSGTTHAEDAKTCGKDSHISICAYEWQVFYAASFIIFFAAFACGPVNSTTLFGLPALPQHANGANAQWQQ